jgi:hypothetical protein
MIENAVNGVPLYEDVHMVCTISFLITLYFFVLFTDLIKNELKLYKNKIELSYFACLFLIIAACVLIVLVFPTIPTFTLSQRRTQGLSSIYGFAFVVLLLSALTFDMSFEYKFLWFFYVFIAFWFLGHGERVELLGWISYLALKILNRDDLKYKYRNKRNIVKEKLKKYRLFIFAFVFLIICVLIGEYRDSGTYKFSFTDLMRKLFVQATAGDVVYVFDCAVDMWKNGNLLHGITYLDYLFQLIPNGPTTYNISEFMYKNYFEMGGGLFFTEPMANFGLIGVFITNITFCVWYYFATKKSTMLRCMFWIPMVIEVFRTCWYGRDGWILGSFVEVPLLYILCRYFLNKVSIRLGKVHYK